MTEKSFNRLVNRCFDITKKKAPYDTGNLRNDATRIVWENQNTVRIYVDEGIAPYMPYTNEPWVSPKWNGKKNPNQYWFDMAAKMCYTAVKRATGVEGTRTDTKRALNIPFFAQKYNVQEKDIYINSLYQVNEYGLRQYWNLQRGKTP